VDRVRQDEGEPRTPVLDVRDVHKSYRRGSEEVHALRGVSLSLLPGEVVVLIGPSGSGKTTLLNVLCGWETAEQGEVLWQGQPATGSLDAIPWAQLAVVPQNLGLMEELSIRENVLLPVRLGGAGSEEDVDDLLRAFGLDHLAARAPWEISLGEQQRAALARALVLGPTLLLADEPTAHQDEEYAKKVYQVLQAATGLGTTCLIASHNREALRAADRVLAIRDGVVRRVEVPADAAEEEIEAPRTLSPRH
jgi:putative ABC transport system ATP-binding protein